MSRHGLLVLLEVCLLGLVLFWCSPATKQKERLSTTASNRRLSLDTLKTEKMNSGKKKDQDKDASTRRRSIEVGTLANGHVGSMIQRLQPPSHSSNSNSSTNSYSSLSKRQRRRRRRKEGRPSSEYLQNVNEDSDEDVYLTYQGRQDFGGTKSYRKRSNSWSETMENQETNSSARSANNSQLAANFLEVSPSSWEQAQTTTGPQDLVVGASTTSAVGPSISHSQLWENHVQHVIKSTRFLVSQVTSEVDRKDDQLRRSSSSRLKEERRQSSSVFNRDKRDSIKLSNLFEVLDNSVHDVDTETDTDQREGKSSGMRDSIVKKVYRSKSTSPTRHANMLRKQKVLFKSFRPEDAEWLQ